MRLVKIPKKKPGEYREICVPSQKEKARFRELVQGLNILCFRLCDQEIVHGFMPFRSPVTNAKKHIGYQYSLKFDLSNFFDTVTPDMVREYLGADTDKYFINGRAYQGLPTSPQIANLAAIKMDKHIGELVYGISEMVLNLRYPDGIEVSDSLRHNYKVVFTRYADDITISFNDYENYKMLLESIPNIVAQYGFSVNPKKTRLQSAKYGWRNITGVSVGPTDIKVSRKVKKIVRALKYQLYQKKVQIVEEKSEVKVTMSGAVQTVNVGGIKRKKIVIVKKPSKKKWQFKRLESMLEWCKLKRPRLPIQHTNKVIEAVVAHLETTSIVKSNTRIKVNLIQIGFVSSVDKICKALFTLQDQYKVKKSLIGRLSNNIWKKTQKDIEKVLETPRKTVKLFRNK